jgi:hypothetical protein
MRTDLCRSCLSVGFVPAALLASILPAAADPADLIFPYRWETTFADTGLAEPSGIVYHPTRGTLFAVSDEGRVAEIGLDGACLHIEHPREADLEGITVVPATGLLYVAVEGEERILELDPEHLRVLREFDVPRSFHGRKVMARGGQGIEAITFVPLPGHPTGGVFYVANQCFDLSLEDDRSGLARVELPDTPPSDEVIEARLTGFFDLPVIDISGVCYDAVRDRLWAISDETNTVWRVTLDGELVAGWALPGDAQEGIAFDAEGNLYIAQDCGGIARYRPTGAE